MVSVCGNQTLAEICELRMQSTHLLYVYLKSKINVCNISSVQTHLKQLIRKGMPREYRRDIWKWKIKDWLKESYIPGMYPEIMKKHVSCAEYSIGVLIDCFVTLCVGGSEVFSPEPD